MTRCGVIEGFFGKTWGWPARLGGIDFLRDLGYEFYIYAPKADAFLRRRWREPMPEETLRNLLQLRLHGAANGVAIGVGLTPFEIYLNYDAGAKNALRAKVRQIDEIGAHWLCILFDDMQGDIDGLARLQAAVVADICEWSGARQFIVAPTYYSYDSRLTKAFGAPPRSYLQDLGRMIDPAIDIFWTGEKIVSSGYAADHLTEVGSVLRRKPFIWDNSISNDSKTRTDHLYLQPPDGWELPPDLVAGLAVNPMNQPYLTRIALCGFHRLMAASGGEKRGEECCQGLGGLKVASLLQADRAVLLEQGLSRMSDDTRAALLARYAGELTPYAQEISAWLRNHYAFDPECLTS